MRLGILVFDNEAGGSGKQAADALATFLRTHDIDVVVNAPEPDALTTPERPAAAPVSAQETDPIQLTTFAQAQEAGARLGRADCDGVLFWLGENAAPAFAPPAALSLSCPILLCGNANNSALYAMAGVLADRGIAFDRLFLSQDEQNDASRVRTWLHQNSKKERQKGTEAAHKLFGKRLIFPPAPNDAAQIVDAAQWFHQFGVLVASANAEAGDDLVVQEEGTGFDALTFFLLHGVCDDDKKAEVRALRAGVAAGESSNELATFAQIFRRKGRFTCLIGLMPSEAIQSEAFAHALFGSTVHFASGDMRCRMKAACFALDVDVVEFSAPLFPE